MLLLCALLLGVVAGLRSMLAPAIVSWFARNGALAVANTPLAFMGYRFTPIILTVFAVGELIADKLPRTPSRKAPPGFVARIVTGALSGATVGAAGHALVAGLILGVIGAVAGTFGGAAARAKLAAAFGRDLPAALLEDIVGIAIAVLSLMAVK
jgi:uncharacterized membrane protein